MPRSSRQSSSCLAFMSERVAFDPGKPLMRQGDPADAAYLIIEGQAEVIARDAGGPVILATLGANEIVGEMGILCNAPRNATVRAKDRLIALRISKEPFMRMVREFPNMAVSIMQELAHRLEFDQQSAARRARRSQSDCAKTAGIAGLIGREPARQLYPAARGAARLPRRRPICSRNWMATCWNSGSATAGPTTIFANSFQIARFMSASARVAAHPDCVPPPELLFLGDMRETLPAARQRLGGASRSPISTPPPAMSRRAGRSRTNLRR